ncbi:MAG TPA: C25 family cysteine peptidase [Bacteroidales bacterium]|nr:C25 family cysteine peptidase [Bacteroidales bacterium]
MMNFYKSTAAILLSLFAIFSLSAQTFNFDDSWANAGFNLSQATQDHVEVVYSIESFAMDEVMVKGSARKAVHLPGTLVPNNEGAPDLAGSSKFIAIPQGAKAQLNVISYRTETYYNIDVAPAPRIPLDTEDGPLFYNEDNSIYGLDAFYPAEPFMLGEATQIRGVDVVMLGVTPFQYNPVSKELVVYRDIRLKVDFEGGNGQFGDNRYRSRWFDPILRDQLLNFNSLPEIAYTGKAGSKSDGFEYVIITPDNPVFTAWADTLKNYRNMQGISTGIYTISEVGGNNINTIEGFINNAYDTWTIPPLAFLIMADYGTSGDGILSPIWDNYCASDHIYGDVNNNGMADVIMARMTAQTEEHLQNMIGKIIEYENDPPTYESYYNPITALGWQTERWFQICSETVGGYFKNVQGKDPIRINEVYGGNPNVDPWSTATNTYTIMNIFGPNGLGYIPASPNELGNWAGGSASDINDAINAGAFILQHRDHGYEYGWGEPDYSNGSLNGLNNEDPVFVFSINCLTGKYNYSQECFTEKFHRMEQGALGLIAASEVSYSFVNDTYVWGLYDYMWPDFLPQFGSPIAEERGMLPAFANVAAKYFLESSSWPYNYNNKEVTYNLFHHHGCAFQTLYSEVPSTLMVLHNSIVLTGASSFSVSADSGAFIALSHNGEILSTAESDGTPQIMDLSLMLPGDVLDVVVTKPNFFRYHATVDVIPGDMPYIVYNEYSLNDADGNSDGILDYGESVLLSLTLENVGLVDALGVDAVITSNNVHVSISDDAAFFGDIASQQTASVTDEYAFDVSAEVGDGEIITFNVEATDGDSIWNSFFYIQAHAPVMEYLDFNLDDSGGNDNGRLDAGETAEITINVTNTGSSSAYNTEVSLSCSGKSFVTVNNGPLSVGDMAPGEIKSATFSITAAENTPGGFNALFSANINADLGITGAGAFDIFVGQFSALILDLDPQQNSGPAMMEAIQDLDLIAYYSTTWPEDPSLYKSVFVSLGIIFTGHEITTTESVKLIQYLSSGGRLYLEGRRTWYDDPQLPIHSKFNIDVMVDTWFEYDTITGEHNTFTDGMMFEFDGTTPYNDYYMVPEDNAFTIFTSHDPEYGCVVAYDEGTYKTIGCAYEFGKLVDGASPSTKERLMLEYLTFFGDIVTSVPEKEDYQPASLNEVYPNPFSDQTTINFNLERDMMVSVEVFNINGSKVATLANARLKAGEHSLQWDGTDNSGNKLGSGIYLCTLRTNSVISTKKIIRY